MNTFQKHIFKNFHTISLYLTLLILNYINLKKEKNMPKYTLGIFWAKFGNKVIELELSIFPRLFLKYLLN